MTCYVALLRAVNVGGSGKLPMGELTAMCEAANFADVRTYIASGNVVFRLRSGDRPSKTGESEAEMRFGRTVFRASRRGQRGVERG